MSIQLTTEQQNATLGALSRREGRFDKEKARVAGARIREIRKGITLDAGHVDPRAGPYRPQILMDAFVLDVSACMCLVLRR